MDMPCEACNGHASDAAKALKKVRNMCKRSIPQMANDERSNVTEPSVMSMHGTRSACEAYFRRLPFEEREAFLETLLSQHRQLPG